MQPYSTSKVSIMEQPVVHAAALAVARVRRATERRRNSIVTRNVCLVSPDERLRRHGRVVSRGNDAAGPLRPGSPIRTSAACSTASARRCASRRSAPGPRPTDDAGGTERNAAGGCGGRCPPAAQRRTARRDPDATLQPPQRAGTGAANSAASGGGGSCASGSGSAGTGTGGRRCYLPGVSRLRRRRLRRRWRGCGLRSPEGQLEYSGRCGRCALAACRRARWRELESSTAAASTGDGKRRGIARIAAPYPADPPSLLPGDDGGRADAGAP